MEVGNRYLRCVPALDLCRLEGSLVANGVNVDEIWAIRQKEPRKSLKSFLSSDDKTESCFPLNICRDRNPFSLAHHFPGSNDLITKMTADISKDYEITPGHRHLLKIASDLLTDFSGSLEANAVERSIRRLISIPGDLLLSNLKTGIRSMHQTCTYPYSSLEVWKQQGIYPF